MVLVERETRKINDPVMHVPLSSERSDAKKWKKHCHNRSESLFKVLKYYWIISIVTIGLLYWCPLLQRY